MRKEELENIEKEIAKLEAEGKKISVQNKMRLKKLQRARDKAKSPIETSSVFVSNSNIEDSVRLIEIDKISMPEFNDRTGIDKEKIEELAQSIKSNGLLQPILLAEDEKGGYVKIAGRRRILATKLNGESKIRAIIKKERLSKREFNLLVLHENTQREDLSAYDRVRSLLNFIEQEFNLSQNEAIKLCNRVNNHNKGNISKDEELESISKTLQSILEETKIFTSLSHLIKHLPVLNMPPTILKLLDNNQISFGLALVINQNFNAKFKAGQGISSIIQHIVEKEMSIKEAKEYFLAMIQKESRAGDDYSKKINQKLSKMRKIALILDKKRQQEFDSELKKLLLKYNN